LVEKKKPEESRDEGVLTGVPQKKGGPRFREGKPSTRGLAGTLSAQLLQSRQGRIHKKKRVISYWGGDKKKKKGAAMPGRGLGAGAKKKGKWSEARERGGISSKAIPQKALKLPDAARETRQKSVKGRKGEETSDEPIQKASNSREKSPFWQEEGALNPFREWEKMCFFPPFTERSAEAAAVAHERRRRRGSAPCSTEVGDRAEEKEV